MPRRADPQLRVLWRKRLQRFSSSGLSVGVFCSQERLSISAFYLWRKKLKREVSGREANNPAQKGFRQASVPEASVPGLRISDLAALI